MKYLTNNGSFKETPISTDKLQLIDGVFKLVSDIGITDLSIITDNGKTGDLIESSEISFTPDIHQQYDRVTIQWESIVNTGTITIDWGDGLQDIIDFSSGTQATTQHTYEITGTFTGSITGDIESLSYLAFAETGLHPGMVYISGTLKVISLPNLAWFAVNKTEVTNVIIANCPLVTEIDLGSDYNHTKIEEFTIYNCPLVSDLYMYYINKDVIDVRNLSNLTLLYLNYSPTTFINIEGLEKLNYVDIYQNSLSSECIDSVLKTLDDSGIENGTAFVDQQTPLAPPSEEGITHGNNLITKGWELYYDGM